MKKMKENDEDKSKIDVQTNKGLWCDLRLDFIVCVCVEFLRAIPVEYFSFVRDSLISDWINELNRWWNRVSFDQAESNGGSLCIDKTLGVQAQPENVKDLSRDCRCYISVSRKEWFIKNDYFHKNVTFSIFTKRIYVSSCTADP